MPRAKSAYQLRLVIQLDYLPYAKCNDCDWQMPESRDTLADAKGHVRFSGHNVTTVYRRVIEYEGIPNDQSSSN